MSTLNISHLMWWQLVHQLRRRGNGKRESGAFILGKLDSRRASRFICYDDLDNEAIRSGIITVHARGFARLWDICQAENLRVLADIHTHPCEWTGQSESDRTHPMVAQPGHLAIILPDFAQRNSFSLRDAGIYEYLGNHRWRMHNVDSSVVTISLL